MDYNLKNLYIKINMIGFFQEVIHEIYIFFQIILFSVQCSCYVLRFIKLYMSQKKLYTFYLCFFFSYQFTPLLPLLYPLHPRFPPPPFTPLPPPPPPPVFTTRANRPLMAEHGGIIYW